MKYHLDWRGWRFYIALNHSVLVEGVNSKLPDGRHFLMFDFDNVGEYDVISALQGVQTRFKLPRIFLVNTGLPNHWHSYCFKAVSYPECLLILAETPLLDQVYFKIGVIRGYFTLRYSPKKGRDFAKAIILPSRYEEDLNPFELINFSKYWTKRV